MKVKNKNYHQNIIVIIQETSFLSYQSCGLKKKNINTDYDVTG